MDAGVKLPPGKTRLMMKRLPFLGHIIGHHSTAPRFDKIEVINLLQEPSNVSQLRSFLGMAQYYSHFIPDFHMMKKPLTVLLQKTTQWHWDLAHQHAFEKIKAALASPSVLRAPDWNRTFIVHTDWSTTGSGYVLAQEDDEHREYVIAYGSSVNSATEANYSSYEGELMAVKKAVKA